MKIDVATRLKKLPPYLFLEIDKAKRKAKQAGKDIIDFGIGDPDQPTPAHVIKTLSQAAKDPANHRYALDQGMPALRKEMASYYKKRFKVNLDPETEILPLIGSKEGIAHFPLAVLNPGDYSLVPDPCYPPYQRGTILAGAKAYRLPLLEKNNFLPDLKAVPASITKKAKLIFINYPNNPTAAVASRSFYQEVLNFARRHKIIVASDLAYSEISFGAYRPLSFLELKGAKDLAIEFHSLSKTYNMTGWRIGWACGNKDLVAALGKVKSNIDSGIFSAVQAAGIAAFRNSGQHIKRMCRIYQERQDVLLKGLNSLGWQVRKPKATFYLWVKIPKSAGKLNSISFAQKLLSEAGIVVTPGVGLGKSGEGYIRFALTIGTKRIKQAIGRLKKLGF